MTKKDFFANVLFTLLSHGTPMKKAIKQAHLAVKHWEKH